MPMPTLTTATAAPQVLADAGVGGRHRAARQEGGQDQGGLRLPDHHQGSSLQRSNIYARRELLAQVARRETRNESERLWSL